MASPLPPDAPTRIVKPRKSNSDWRPVIALSRDHVVVESMDGSVFPASDLGKILYTHPPAILAVQGFGTHLQRLQREFANDPAFNYRVTPLERYSRPWSNGHEKIPPGLITDAICNFVGWKDGIKKRVNRYHYPLDPFWFLTTAIDEIDDRLNTERVAKLFKWATEVRDWCHTNGLQVKASSGGVAAQLLRDSRFYPEPRRKVPRRTNAIARSQLPGNYYRLPATTELHKRYQAIYLDMENAHHAMARRIHFPDANTLYRYGDWSHTARAESDTEPVGTRQPRATRPSNSPILGKPGLFHISLSVPHIGHNLFPPPYMDRPGTRSVYVYSNELELIQQLGGTIECVHAAYVSDGEERGLNRYAEFALQEIRTNPDYKPWLKPTLHSTYGLLAARPLPFETGYYRALGGEPTEYPMGNVSIPAIKKRRDNPIESRIANVIHRGMIEAQVRKEALWMARYMTELGFQVLAIYADAVFIRDKGRDIPLLDPPWRVSKRVGSLRFFSPVHFTSPAITRLPGVPRNERQRILAARGESGRQIERYWDRGAKLRELRRKRAERAGSVRADR